MLDAIKKKAPENQANESVYLGENTGVGIVPLRKGVSLEGPKKGSVGRKYLRTVPFLPSQPPPTPLPRTFTMVLPTFTTLYFFDRVG